MPYAAALLDLYTSVMSRQAFDLDFMSPGLAAMPLEGEEAEAQAVEIQGAIAMPVAVDQPAELKASESRAPQVD